MYESLMEEAVKEENRVLALKAVKRNHGAPGIDHMKTTELESHLQAHWEKIRTKLLAGTWVPSPVRRVEILKQSGGTRMLGIPTVIDRLIQQMLLQVLTPIFDPMFSEHSHGFRPGRSAPDAVRAAQRYAQEGKDWVVDLDITKFFDHVNHDILMGRIGTTIRDKRMLSLIGKYLRRGAMVDGLVEASVEGAPQGGPLTPRTQKITSILSGGFDFCGNQVRIDACRIRLYFYDRCRVPAKPKEPSASITRATSCCMSINSRLQSSRWRRTVPYRRVKPIATSNKLSS
jgi:Reverse transcriptase (RNA-dependent DNA polymerase)